MLKRHPDYYLNQTAEDAPEIAERADKMVSDIRDEAKAICNTRWPKDYFAKIGFDSGKIEVQGDAEKIFECATDIRTSHFINILEERVRNGQKNYTIEHFNLARELIDKITARDLADGKIT
jgi:hypothetical protein